MDHVTTPVTSSVLLRHDMSDIPDGLTQDHPPGVALQELGHTDLVDVLRTNSVAVSTRLVAPLTSSSVSVVAMDNEKHSANEQSLLSTTLAAAYSLPSIMSLSSFTASSVDNNNVSINCSFTNSSIDSRDDDVYGLHVTFDEDNRPQLKTKDRSQLSGFAPLKAAGHNTKTLASVEVSCSNSVATSSSSQIACERSSTSPTISTAICEVSCGVINPLQSECPLRSLPSEDVCHHSVSASREPAAAADTTSSTNTAVDHPTPKEVNINNADAVGNGNRIGSEEAESSSGRDQTNAQEVPTTSDHGLVSSENNHTVCNSNGDATPTAADAELDANSASASNKVDHLSSPPTPVAKSNRADKNHSSSCADPGMETSKHGPAAAVPVTPVRKSVRTHKNPLTNSEFVSLDISPRSRAKAAASKKLSLDSSSAAAVNSNTTARTKAGKRLSLDSTSTISHTTTSRTKAARSLPTTQPQTSKPRKELPRVRKRGPSTAASECGTGLEQQKREKCSTSEHLPAKRDPKTRNSLNPSLSADPVQLKRKPGRPRKNQTVVNGKSVVHYDGAQLAAGGSWSSLNSKAAGDSSLGNIGLVSELFSVTPFTPASSHSSVPSCVVSVVRSESNTPALKPADGLSLPSKAPSPADDLSFALDELSPVDHKHKKKKKKKKKKDLLA